jgi:integrase
LLAKALCSGCGQLRRPDPRHPGEAPTCSECAGLAPLHVCRGCGDETRIYTAGRCRRCVLAARLDVLLAGPDGAVAPELAPLADALVATPSAKAALRWIATPATAALLRGLATGDMPLTHAGLDGVTQTGVVAHLRALLVAPGILDARDEVLAALEIWVGEIVATVEHPEDRHLVDTYATWWVLRRCRQRAERRPTTDDGPARTNIRTAIALCAWLREHDRDLGCATQADIDLWTATVSASARRAGHDLLRWATRHGVAHDVAIARRPAVAPKHHPSPAPEERVELARRLLVDDRVMLAERVAALLVLLYAQPLSHIVRLRVEDVSIDEAGVSIHLGRDPIQLPAPFDALVARLVEESATSGGGWLFPGDRPGRHRHPEPFGSRLNALGLRVRAGRTNTLLDLAADTPLVALADLLGLHANTAYRWVRAAGGEWSHYAAGRIRPG